MIRASFAGPSGSGKTTLATWLAYELGLMVNPVGSRSIATELGLESPYDADKFGMRTAFQETLQERKIAWELAHESFVTDRTTLDELVYSGLHGDPSEEYKGRAFNHMARYTHVFYCPFASFCDIASDPTRMQSLDYQRQFDDELRVALFETWNDACSTHVETIAHSDLESRKNQIRAALGLPLVVRPGQ